MPSLAFGISMSSMAIEMPPRVARRKPDCISLSAKITVSRRPQRRNDWLIRREISFFFRALFSTVKGRPLGRISDSSARPTVVSWRCLTGCHSPCSSRSYSVRRTVMRVCSSTSPLS
ncbi:Uncharacterised protein [Bordetella pertussis]|nr:Uncharacterised protein [Bordetella pertussis]